MNVNLQGFRLIGLCICYAPKRIHSQIVYSDQYNLATISRTITGVIHVALLKVCVYMHARTHSKLISFHPSSFALIDQICLPEFQEIQRSQCLQNRYLSNHNLEAGRWMEGHMHFKVPDPHMVGVLLAKLLYISTLKNKAYSAVCAAMYLHNLNSPVES